MPLDSTELAKPENAGICAALCAVAFFRARHHTEITRSRRKNRAPRSLNQQHVESCRRHIRLARAAGWRGSILKALQITP